VIQLHELVRFFSNPIAYLINRRLQVYLREPDIDVPDREPWQLDKLEEWDVATTLLELELGGRGKGSYSIARAAGDLPPGQPGQLAYEELMAKVMPIANAVREHRGPARAPNLTLDLTLSTGVRLSGELEGRWTGGSVFAQYSRVRGKHVLACWIRHLAGCLVVPEGENRGTTLIGRPETGDGLEIWRYRQPKDPLSTIAELVELFDLGQSAPLLLFPSSSLAYARSLANQWNSDLAIQAARAIWEGKSPNWAERIPSERDDPHYLRTLGAAYALGDQAPCPVAGDLGFEDLATKVFGPLLAHAECSRQ
jgi:exodeoxyribonuclease V gamma subunit